MISADSSIWVDYINRGESASSNLLDRALSDRALWISPFVLFELLSSKALATREANLLKLLPQLEIKLGLFERAAELRSALLKKKLKARSMDCLIAQSCIDYGIPLLVRDGDFKHFEKFGLKAIWS